MPDSIQYMERKHSTLESEPAAADGRSVIEPTTDRPAATIAATTRATDPSANALTIVGHGTPTSFEITVDGEIEPRDGDVADAVTVSGSTVEGTIETGTIRFRFTGDLADVTFVDRRITGPSPAAVPNVHVDYTAPEESRS